MKLLYTIETINPSQVNYTFTRCNLEIYQFHAKIAPFSRNLFTDSLEGEPQKFLDCKNRKQRARFAGFLRVPWRKFCVEVAAVTLLAQQSHVFRLARKSWGYGATGVPDGLLCHVRRFQLPDLVLAD